nr:hypothetical protein [Tanacetum cinerariifolium]
MNPNNPNTFNIYDPNNPDSTNTYDHYDVYFQGDRDQYMRDYPAYEKSVALCEQEVEGSRSGPKRRRTYIPHEREDAEQRLIDDYFGDDEFLPKYPEENFKRRQRYDATGRLSIGPILKCTSIIRQLAYITAPDAFDEVPVANNDLNVLYGSSLFDDELVDRASECPFVVNGHTYRKCYYLADGIYPAWSMFVKTFSVARDEKTLKFKRVQEKILNELSESYKISGANGYLPKCGVVVVFADVTPLFGYFANGTTPTAYPAL